MRRTTFATIAGCFAALVVVPSTAYTQEQSVTFAVYFECDQSKEARTDTLVTEVFAPLYDRYVSEGKLQSWAWLAHDIGGKWRRLLVYAATDRTVLLNSRAEIIAELQENHPAEFQEFVSICHTHEDYIWNVVITRP